MSEPITWRTILGPSVADAARPMDMAGRYINTAFENLQSVLQNREQQNQQNVAALREFTVNKNTNDLQNMLAGKTPEQLAAMKTDGTLAARIASYGGAVDQNTARDAFDQRMATARDQVTKGQAYTDEQQKLKDRPIVDNILSTLYKGDGKGATALLDANPHLLGHADVQKKVADYMATLDQRSREATRFTWDSENHAWALDQHAEEKRLRPLREEQLRTGIAASRASTATSVYGLDRLKESDRTTRAAAEMDAALKDNPYREGIYTDAAAADLRKMMKDNNIGDSDGERNKVIDRLTNMKTITIQYKDPTDGVIKPKQIPLPLSTVKAAVLGSEDQLVNMWNQGWANTVENRLKTLLQGNEQAGTDTLGHYLKYSDLLGAQAKTVQGGSGGKKR